jgi:hypothetical protein
VCVGISDSKVQTAKSVVGVSQKKGDSTRHNPTAQNAISSVIKQDSGLPAGKGKNLRGDVNTTAGFYSSKGDTNTRNLQTVSALQKSSNQPPTPISNPLEAMTKTMTTKTEQQSTSGKLEIYVYYNRF